MPGIKSIKYSEIKYYTCALIDVTSLSMLQEHRNDLEMNIDSDRLYKCLFDKARQNEQFQITLKILERMVVYDFVVFDNYGGQKLKNTLPATDLFRSVSVPPKIYAEVANKVLGSKDSENKELIQQLSKMDDGFDGQYKSYLDALHKKYPMQMNIIADTDNTAARMLFYLHLSTDLGVPIFLSPSKDHFLAACNTISRPEFFKKIGTYTDKELQQALEFLLNLSPHALASVPPLAEYLLYKANERKTSLLSIVTDLHDEPMVRDFREWMGKIQHNLLSGTRKGWVSAAKDWTKFKTAFQKWASSFSMSTPQLPYGESIRITVGPPPSLNLPIGVGVSIPVSKLSSLRLQPRYLSFIIEWYQR